jgi:hypothetical protein
VADNFHRVYISAETPDAFIRGAGRLLVAAITQAFPDDIGDIVNLSSYDAQSGWSDLGGTKTGITITNNNTEETFDIDQVLGDIDSRPTGWEYTVATALSEMTPERMQLAWEGGTISTVGGEKQLGFGQPSVYTRRRLAVLFQKSNEKLRAYVFRIVQRTPQESSIAFNKTGEQQTLAVRFRALADTSIADARERFGMMYDQV